MFNKSVHLTNGLMTPRLAVHILPIPVETITSPIMGGIADKMKSVRLVQIFFPVKETNRTHSKSYVEDLLTKTGGKRCAKMSGIYQCFRERMCLFDIIADVTRSVKSCFFLQDGKIFSIM